MAGREISEQEEVLSVSDPEVARIADTFRRALGIVVGIAAALSLAAAWFYQPATMIGLALIVAGVYASAITIAAIVALVRYR